MNGEAIMQAKIVLAAAEAAVVAYDSVIEIPKALIEAGKKAKRGLDA